MNNNVNVFDLNFFFQLLGEGHRAGYRAGMCENIIPTAEPWERTAG